MSFPKSARLQDISHLSILFRVTKYCLPLPGFLRGESIAKFNLDFSVLVALDSQVSLDPIKTGTC